MRGRIGFPLDNLAHSPHYAPSLTFPRARVCACACEQHTDSDKLFCEEIDVGEEQPRQIASGLRAHFTLENFCPGRKVVVVTNLKAAKMAGFESQGMVMASVHPEVPSSPLRVRAPTWRGPRIFRRIGL